MPHPSAEVRSKHVHSMLHLWRQLYTNMDKQAGKVEKEFKIQPHKETSQPQEAKQFAATKAHPGPAIPQNMPELEGTKEERQAKAKELNK